MLQGQRVAPHSRPDAFQHPVDSIATFHLLKDERTFCGVLDRLGAYLIIINDR